MVFLDTCIWIELLGVRTPVKEHEKRQAFAASNLFDRILRENENIVTCEEQLLELISAIEKVKMKSVSSLRKERNLSGIGNLKSFRDIEEFEEVKVLCDTVINDVRHFASVNDIGNYKIDSILKRLDLADINDCLYYDYCIDHDVELYTFDDDLTHLGEYDKLHII